MRVTRCVLTGACVLMLLVAGERVRTDDPVTSSVSFNREIIRIFDRKCLSCHKPGGLAMSLLTYREVRPWTRAIREEIVEGRMPPWPAAKGYARFESDIGLTPRELSTILTWADGGMPRGDDSDLPVPAHRHETGNLGTADRIMALPAQQVPGEWQQAVRRVTIDAGLDRDRWIDHVEVRPGDHGRLRAAFVSVISKGREPLWMGGWMPWQTVVKPPTTGAFLLPAGSRLQVELHYLGKADAGSDSSSIALFFAPGSRRELASVAIAATADAGTKSAGGQRTLPRESLVWAVHPASVGEGQTLEVTAHKPNGSVEVLLWIPAGRAQWPAAFILKDPVRLPAGTRVRVLSTGAPVPDGGSTVLALQYAG